jgi:hypothetical protein
LLFIIYDTSGITLYFPWTIQILFQKYRDVGGSIGGTPCPVCTVKVVNMIHTRVWANEVIEEKDILTQARGPEGPLSQIPKSSSSASIFPLMKQNTMCKSALSNTLFSDLSDRNFVDLEVDNQTIQKTTKCPSAFKCQRDDAYPLCAPESSIPGYGLFVRPPEANSCHYKMSFGNGFICTCPTRYEIFTRYKR